MPNIANVTVKLTVEAIEKCPELRDLLRQLIREELANLDEKTADKVATRITRSMVKAAGMRR